MMTDEELYDLIDEWADLDGAGMELHEYLGWTAPEYKHWVKTRERPARFQ